MSALIFNGYGNGAATRRKTRKWQSHHAAPVFAHKRETPEAGLPLPLPGTAKGRSKRASYELVLLVALALAVHGAIVFFLISGRQATPATPPHTLRTPPIEIEIVKPKPLPSAPAPAPAPPVPRKLEPVVPRVARPAPARPAPQPANETAPDSVPAVAVAATAATAPPAATVIAKSGTDAAPAPAEHVTQPRGDAAYLNNPSPKYPPVALSRGWEGQVILKVHVLANGRPDSVAVALSSGRKTLDEAAARAVADWLFVPAKRGQTAIDGWVQVPIDFNLGK